jgi:lipopolysaccharide transport system permease protein
MVQDLRILYGYRQLLAMWSVREIKVRYKQSLLGVGWAVLQPLALMAIFTLVFSLFARLPSDGIPYPLFSYTSLLIWTFFSTSITFAIPTLVNNFNLVTKIYFPREILPIASVVAAFVDFLLASIILLVVVFIYQVPLTLNVLWVPVIVAVQILLTVGVTLPASAFIVFYRDVRFVVPLGIQLWMYASPVIYPVSMVPERFRVLYALNPMVGIVDSYRRVIIQGEAPNLQYLAISTLVSLSLAGLGYLYFKRSEGSFADLI